MMYVVIKGGSVKIDQDDYDAIKNFEWKVVKRGRRSRYAIAKCTTCCQSEVYMHRLILGLKRSSDLVDHIDHDGLNNERSNLRVVTKKQNQWNTRKRNNRPTSSRYKGVTWVKSKDRWKSYIQVSGKHIHLGYHSNQEDAARSYDKAAKKHFGDHACINFK